MKFFSWLLTFIVLVAALSFALHNRQDTTLSLWPFGVEVVAPLYIFAIGTLFIGVLLGAIFGWAVHLRFRVEARRLRRDITRLHEKIEDMRTASGPQGRDMSRSLIARMRGSAAYLGTAFLSIDVKICGITDAPGLKAAIDGSARYVGFVFFPPSRNFVTAETVQRLAAIAPPEVIKTGMFVDARDDEMRDIARKIPLDLIQLHGKETPQRVTEVKALTGLPVMMAIRIVTAAEFDNVHAYEAVADKLLFDSRMGAESSGGPIDWSLLKTRTFKKPWLLAGGLTAQNLSDAVKASGATAVDVSSGVEERPGHKSPEKVSEFLAIAAAL